MGNNSTDEAPNAKTTNLYQELVVLSSGAGKSQDNTHRVNQKEDMTILQQQLVDHNVETFKQGPGFKDMNSFSILEPSKVMNIPTLLIQNMIWHFWKNSLAHQSLSTRSRKGRTPSTVKGSTNTRS